MKFTPTVPLVAVGLAAVFLAHSPSRVSADEWDEAVRLAHKLEKFSGKLRGEFQQHFRFSYYYVRLMGQLNGIDSGIEHIHNLTHDSYASAGHLQQDVANIDRAVHQLHDLLDEVDSGRSGRHVQGNTKHVHRQLDNMTRVLHSLEDLSKAIVRKEEQRRRQLAAQRQRELEAQRRREHQARQGRYRSRGGHHSSRDPHGRGAHGQTPRGHGSRQQPSRQQWNPFSRQAQPQQPPRSRRSTGRSNPRYTPARPAPSTPREPGATPEQFLRHAFGIFR